MGNNRIAKWDNLKFMLILLVVTGHTLNYFTDYSDLAKGLYLFIYSFHMPAFVFVAGLFAKSAVQKKKWENVVEFLLIYVVMKFLQCLGNVIAGQDVTFHLLWAAGPEWFALAMAVFIAVTMLIQRFDWKCMMAITLFIGCVAGLDTHFGDHFASMRICVFYPVFLAGYYTDFRAFASESTGVKWLLRIVGLGIMVIDLAVCIMFSDNLYPFIKILKGKYEYADLNMGISGVAVRFGCYVLWAIMIAAVVYIAPNIKLICTWFGQRTMAIFIWHSLALIIVFKALNVTHKLLIMVPHFYLISAICIAALVTIICAYLPEFRISKKLKKEE